MARKIKTSKKIDKSFRFCTRLHLKVLTGLKANNIQELLNILKRVPGSSIYYHTHHYLQQHEYLSPEPPNDFAHWITNSLNDKVLGEKIASIDTIEHSSIRSLREDIINIIKAYIREHKEIIRRFVSPEEAFHFMKCVSFVIPTPYIAKDLESFAGILGKVTLDSLYFHLFEARLRLNKGGNDFSWWLESSLLEGELADKLRSLDPYTYAMEDLRRKIIDLVRERLKK
ncbi:MAG: DUF5752 family protein [Candidatus Omnitrophota bacterium]